MAVGGHVRAGETIAVTVREAEEEIGLALTLSSLTPLGRRHARAGALDNEIQDAFAVRCDRPLTEYRLHEDEVDGLVAMPLEAALALFEGRATSAGAVELPRGAAVQKAIDVALRDFAAAADRDGYPPLALRGLAEVVAGTYPQPFLLR